MFNELSNEEGHAAAPFHHNIPRVPEVPSVFIVDVEFVFFVYFELLTVNFVGSHVNFDELTASFGLTLPHHHRESFYLALILVIYHLKILSKILLIDCLEPLFFCV